MSETTDKVVKPRRRGRDPDVRPFIIEFAIFREECVMAAPEMSDDSIVSLFRLERELVAKIENNASYDHIKKQLQDLSVDSVLRGSASTTDTVDATPPATFDPATFASDFSSVPPKFSELPKVKRPAWAAEEMVDPDYDRPKSTTSAWGGRSSVASPIEVSPKCPQCDGGMAKRTAKKGRGAGSQFWGCLSYPKCKGTRAY